MRTLNFIPLLASLLISGCTLTVTTVHTQGKAADVVDETSTNTPTVSPNISAPLLKGPFSP